MIQGVRPTSKAALKHQCLIISHGDVKAAKELYDYYTDGMDELPMFDPIAPTWQENTKNTVNGLLEWLKENQETLTQGYEFVRGMMRRTPPAAPGAASGLPPINTEAV